MTDWKDITNKITFDFDDYFLCVCKLQDHTKWLGDGGVIYTITQMEDVAVLVVNISMMWGEVQTTVKTSWSMLDGSLITAFQKMY